MFKNNKILILLTILFFIGSIIVLYNSSIFEGFSASNNKFTVEYYYMDNCGYCITFNPEWDIFVSKNNSSSNYDTISYNIADSSIGTSRATKFNINATPTIIITDKNDIKIATFNNDRDAKTLIKFADKICNNSSVENFDCSEKKLEALKTPYLPV